MSAIARRNLTEVGRLLASGLEINARDCSGDPYLYSVVFEAMLPREDGQAEGGREFVAGVIDLGADPNLLDVEGGSVLIEPIFARDAAMLELLLTRGADPNGGCGGSPSESIYDLADFDYRFETGVGWTEAPPQGLTDEDAYLSYLDRTAQETGRPRPEILILLRRYGAMSGSEIAQSLGGNGSEGIVWRGDRWRIID